MKTLFSVVMLALAAICAPIAFAQTTGLRSVEQRPPQVDDDKLAAALIQASAAEALLDEPLPGEISDPLHASTLGGLEDSINDSIRKHAGLPITRIRLTMDQRPTFRIAGTIQEPAVVINGYSANIFYAKQVRK